MSKKIGVVIGSLRKNSFSESIANYIVSVAPEGYEFKVIEIGDLPFFNQDLEDAPPASWVRLREDVKSVDGLLFFTPEYNRSLPAVLKNALDVGSRPYGQSVWGGKPAGVISVSPGGIGGFGANHHLRQVLSFLDVHPLQQPEAYIGNVMAVLDENGKVANEETKSFLAAYAQAFAAWVERF